MLFVILRLYWLNWLRLGKPQKKNTFYSAYAQIGGDPLAHIDFDTFFKREKKLPKLILTLFQK